MTDLDTLRPDRSVSVRELFGFTSDLMVPAFSEREDHVPEIDKTYRFGDLAVYVDQASLLYLDGAEVDYVENLEGAGFKFGNPNVKSTCGCGSSFSA